MKKSLIFLLCAGLIFSVIIKKESMKDKILERIENERIFYYTDYENYRIGDILITESENEEWASVTYDFNKNGEIDAGANFKLKGTCPSNYEMGDKASMVFINSDEGGEIFYYLDKNNDGILETKGVKRYPRRDRPPKNKILDLRKPTEI